MGRPVITAPDASYALAVNCFAAPTLPENDEGDTTTFATVVAVGAVAVVVVVVEVEPRTEMLDVPRTPFTVATSWALPPPVAVAKPDALTDTTAAFVVDQLTVTPLSAVPDELYAVAENCAASPTEPDADDGDTVTRATVFVVDGAGVGVGFVVVVVLVVVTVPFTCVLAEPLFPSLVAVSVASPGPTARAKPVWSTVTAEGLLLDHAIERPASVFPFASRSVAVKGALSPTSPAALPGVTVTLATGAVVMLARVAALTGAICLKGMALEPVLLRPASVAASLAASSWTWVGASPHATAKAERSAADPARPIRLESLKRKFTGYYLGQEVRP